MKLYMIFAVDVDQKPPTMVGTYYIVARSIQRAEVEAAVRFANDSPGYEGTVEFIREGDIVVVPGETDKK